ncbi:MAG TPA: cache domain-containing protein [Spirochaetota bacterium]|nr:cache domain-containing protein [Spirochaetota bacterium]HNT10994.1 cache domain-containing protein [Spirochaetota bacterium]HOS38350.1 cache domain-containing protein [Spirochaetota bacterium]HPU89873.1 cache domain-containing protein [Spirochaetota bacterium]
MPLRRVKANIRIKLTASLLSVVLITGGVSVVVGVSIINDKVVGQAYETVQNDLKTARYIYDDMINVIHLFIKHLASLAYLQEAVAGNDRALLIRKLKEVREELNLDVLNITDATGRVIVRARNENVIGDSVADDSFVREAIRNRASPRGTGIMGREELLREGRDLAEAAYIEIRPTPMARAKEAAVEERAMVLKAAAPIVRQGRLIGVIYGAKVLNKDYTFVDRIKRMVFKDDTFKGTPIGTATVFLNDLRISTNVIRKDGSRAIGTRVSEDVYNKVIVNQGLWLDKAFVVNDWYISAYSPIYDIENRVIGILYVGILEAKYQKIRNDAAFYFLLIIIISAIIAILLSLYLIQNIIIPINALVDASRDIANGIYTKKLEVESADELGYLCLTFNKMIDAIEERDRRLKEQTEQKLAQSEKLASLGRLASGIAHEINNPLTGVLTYSSLLLEDLKGTDHEDDLHVIVTETLRCRDIVRGILDFARDTGIEKKLVDVNKVIINSVAILERHMSFQNVQIVKELDDSIPVMELDINQFQSVISNLAVNAADAMPHGGTLTVRTRCDRAAGRAIIEVEDTGAGISEENITKIFDPFFTTKETGKGTGLGLAVTYGIIARHKGTIDVRSTVGVGTTFTITLPLG